MMNFFELATALYSTDHGNGRENREFTTYSMDIADDGNVTIIAQPADRSWTGSFSHGKGEVKFEGSIEDALKYVNDNFGREGREKARQLVDYWKKRQTV